MFFTPPHFFPLFPLFWLLPLLIARGVGSAVYRSLTLSAEEDPAASESRKERELLLALERKGQLTAVRTALETSLSVAEADERLLRLAGEGHVRVRARGGSLAYSLWDQWGELEGDGP